MLMVMFSLFASVILTIVAFVRSAHNGGELSSV